MDDRISHLKKVHLSIRSTGRSDQKVLETPPLNAELIVGLHPEGLSPLEAQLMDKKVGEKIRLVVSQQNRCALLGHLQIPLPPPDSGHTDNVEIILTIAKICEPSDREVVKAMAGLAAGCGDGCDCGCGGH